MVDTTLTGSLFVQMAECLEYGRSQLTELIGLLEEGRDAAPGEAPAQLDGVVAAVRDVGVIRIRRIDVDVRRVPRRVDLGRLVDPLPDDGRRISCAGVRRDEDPTGARPRPR